MKKNVSAAAPACIIAQKVVKYGILKRKLYGAQTALKIWNGAIDVLIV